MVRRRAGTQAGFVITLELILIITILGIGTLAGIIAIRNALIKWLGNKQAQTVWVYDSAGIVLGPARDFDEHEAPRLFYIDREVEDWGGNNYRAFVGVRDDRFTGRQRIFYTNSLDCGFSAIDGNLANVQACIFRPSDEDGDSRGVGFIGVTVEDGVGGTFSGTAQLGLAGGVGYLYPLQSAALTGPTYGVGRDLDDASGLPGTLYRQSPASCNASQVRSVWTSQLVFSGLPCEVLPAGVTIEAAKCPVGQDTELSQPCSSPADLRCRSVGECDNIPNRHCADATPCLAAGFACADTGYPCTNTGNPLTTGCQGVCNDNFTTPCDDSGDCGGGVQCIGDQGICTGHAGGGSCVTTPLECHCPNTHDGDPFNDWIDTGANCCPAGSIEAAPGQCSIGDDASIRLATPVQLGGVNVFSTLTPPFHVNLPPDPNSLVLTDPTGVEGGGPGTPIGPYEAPDFQFTGTPDDEGP